MKNLAPWLGKRNTINTLQTPLRVARPRTLNQLTGEVRPSAVKNCTMGMPASGVRHTMHTVPHTVYAMHTLHTVSCDQL